MQETSSNYIPMLIYKLLLECLFNFVEKYMKQLVFRSIWPNLIFFSKTGLVPWKRNTDQNGGKRSNKPVSGLPLTTLSTSTVSILLSEHAEGQLLCSDNY